MLRLKDMLKVLFGVVPPSSNFCGLKTVKPKHLTLQDTHSWQVAHSCIFFNLLLWFTKFYPCLYVCFALVTQSHKYNKHARSIINSAHNFTAVANGGHMSCTMQMTHEYGSDLTSAPLSTTFDLEMEHTHIRSAIS